MHTTTISKFPILNFSNSHNTRVPSYEFDIDFIGTGVDAFVGQISKKHGHRFKDRNQADLSHLVKLYVAHGTPQGLISELPVWAWQGDRSFHQGIDISQPLEMTVWNGEQRIYYDNESGVYSMTNFVNEDACWSDVGDLRAETPYLYARDTYDIRVSYSVTSDKPFDPDLIAMQCEDVRGSRFINRFEYDGQTIERELIHWPYADPNDRVVQILFK